jgi:hypothetical protein
MSGFIGVYEKLASDDYCDRMIHRFDELNQISSGSCGQDVNGGLKNRKDVAFYFNIEDPSLTQETNQILDSSLSMYINEYPSFGMVSCYSNIVKVQKTGAKGGFHKWHSEHTGDIGSFQRCLVWMIYLNDTLNDEGTTEFLELGVRVQPRKGTVVLFPASWTHTHRGNPVYNGDKYIATGWYNLN